MKPTVIDPKTTTRAAAFDLWMNAPNPMVTFFKTLDVTPLVRVSRKRGYKFMPEHRATEMRKCRRMKFLCIISGCPTGARKWHISYFCHAFAWQK